MDVLVDASAIMAVILNEPNRDKVIQLTENAVLLTPEVISFEIGNALINLYKRHKITEGELVEAYRVYTTLPMRIIKVDIERSLKIACRYQIYAYDAYYLEIAYRYKIPLVTFDSLMRRVALSLKIDVPDIFDKGGRLNENL